MQGLHVLFVVLIYGMFTLYRMAMSKKLLETPHGNVMNDTFLVVVLWPEVQQLHGNN